MSTQEVRDYLTKQIFIEKNVVTYRSLSRALAMHVNAAKNELATFHNEVATSSEPIAATYLVAESTSSGKASGESDDDPDSDHDMDMIDGDDKEDVAQTTITLVPESELEVAKSPLASVLSIHIYSLSPAPLRDAGLICGPTDSVRQVDGSKGPEMAAIVGKIVGVNIEMNLKLAGKPGRWAQPQPVASTSKTKLSESSTVPNKDDGKEKFKMQSDSLNPVKEDKVASSAVDRRVKTAGKLDFSKAKTKEMKREEFKKELECKGKATDTSATITRLNSAEVAETNEPKRGVKRKSPTVLLSDAEETSPGTPSKPSGKLDFSNARVKEVEQKPSKVKEDRLVVTSVTASRKNSGRTAEKRIPGESKGAKRKSTAFLSDSEDTSPGPATRISTVAVTGPRVKRGVVLSDDEDIPQPSRRKGKIFATDASDIDSEAEKNLRDMMNEDDDQVIRVLRGDPEEEDGDVEMDIGDEAPPEPKPKLRKKAVKKVIPLGRNGLKKRRVVKSRKTIDSKGYMATEDYSSYESIEEEEAGPEPAAEGRGKGKGKAATSVKKETSAGDVAPEPPAKIKSTDKPAQAPPAKARSGAKLKPAGSKGGGQKSLANFFGPPTTKEKK